MRVHGNARGRVAAAAAGQPKPENAACTSVCRKFSLFYSYFHPPPHASASASVVASATALYLSAAVLVGEIVCNHENLISAQIC